MTRKHTLDGNVFYQFGRWLTRWLPEWYCRLFARGMADLTMVLDRELLAIKAEHYRHLFPEHTERARRRLARECFRNYASCIVDMFYAVDLTPQRLAEFIVERRGDDHFLAARTAGRGIIVVSGHLGSWELGGGYIGQHGVPVAVLSKAEDDDELERYRRQYRERVGARTVVVGRDPLSLLEAARFLRDGGVIVTMGDVLLGGPSAVVPFSGGHARFPTGWVTLAAATGAVVLPSFLVPRPGHRFAIVMEPPIAVDSARGAERDAAIQAAVAAYARALEPHVRAHPDWWFAFRPLFEPTAPPPSSRHPAPSHDPTDPAPLPAVAAAPAVARDAGRATHELPG